MIVVSRPAIAQRLAGEAALAAERAAHDDRARRELLPVRRSRGGSPAGISGRDLDLDLAAGRLLPEERVACPGRSRAARGSRGASRGRAPCSPRREREARGEPAGRAGAASRPARRRPRPPAPSRLRPLDHDRVLLRAGARRGRRAAALAPLREQLALDRRAHLGERGQPTLRRARGPARGAGRRRDSIGPVHWPGSSLSDPARTPRRRSARSRAAARGGCSGGSIERVAEAVGRGASAPAARSRASSAGVGLRARRRAAPG